jgi:UDP-GlcNAc:undecaprenyl-phosphate/decaprenyl-phosphate GlcNAc-1-phosphate transferase
VIAYLFVFIASAGTTFALTPVVRKLAIRFHAVDEPNDRKVHPTALPTMGGIAMYVGLLAGLGLSRLLPFFSDMNGQNSESLDALVTCSLILVLGLVDDRRGIMALTKFTGQIFVVGVLILLGETLRYVWLPGHEATGNIVSLAGDPGVLLTFVWTLTVINAVNLLDGLDGLAAGMIAIAAAVFFVEMVHTTSSFGDASPAALLSIITAGICVGFLPWNFHPAKIFMGDSGAMILGMLLAIATISGVGRNVYPPSPGDLASVLGAAAVPLLVLFIPFLDVALAILRRTRRLQGPGQADKEHIHHRLMEIGHTHRQAVLLMYLWSLLISGSALAIGVIDGRLAVSAILAGATLLFLFTALPRLSRARRNGDAHPPPGPGVDPPPLSPAVGDKR